MAKKYRIKDKKYVEPVIALISGSSFYLRNPDNLESITTDYVIAEDSGLYSILRNEGLTHWLEEIPGFEVGTWYEFIDDNIFGLVCYKGENSGYGWTAKEMWANLINITDITLWKEADPELVREMLIKEAKKRNYTAHNHESLSLPPTIYPECGVINPDINKWQVCLDDNRMWTQRYGKGGNLIFDNGVWAKTQEVELPVIMGHRGKDTGTHIQYGCQSYLKETLQGLLFMSLNCDIEIKIGNTPYYISKSNIKEIQEYLKTNP